MKRGRAPFESRPKPQEVASMGDVLAQLQRSKSIYFVKSLSKTRTRQGKKTATLSLPTEFAKAHGDKIEKWVILRAHPSWGRSKRPWAVRLSVTWSPEAITARLCGGFYAFVVGNRLREGDSLIFVLQEDARSEFEVYMFRGPRGIPLYPDEDDSASSDDENNSHSNFSTPLHHHHVHKMVLTNNVKEEAKPSQTISRWQNQHVFPSFRKRMTASNIKRYDRDFASNSGQFELPMGFLKTHGQQVQNSIKLQGIYEDSPTHVVTCRRRSGTKLRVDFLVTGWNRFVKENGLEKGHELQFSLVADSYFVVRKV